MYICNVDISKGTNIQDSWTVGYTSPVSIISAMNKNVPHVKTIAFTGTTSDVGTIVAPINGVSSDAEAIFLYAYDDNPNYWCKLYGFSSGTITLGVCNYGNGNAASETHTIYTVWLIKG